MDLKDCLFPDASRIGDSNVPILACTKRDSAKKLVQWRIDEKIDIKSQDEVSDFVALLRCCTKNKDIHRGNRLHHSILRRGLVPECSDALATLYAKCGALSKAKMLLDMYGSSDVISWNTLLAGFARLGQIQEAFRCYQWMQQEGVVPNAVTYTFLLKFCGNLKDLDKGQQIRDDIEKQGLLQKDLVLGNALLDMYAKCGDLLKAEDVLEHLPYRDVVSWSTLIAGLVQYGQGEQALYAFERMLLEGIFPNAITYSCVLKACGLVKDIDKGKKIHEEIRTQGLLHNDLVLCGALVDMYAKCGALSKARRVLKELRARDVFSWSALIAGYAEAGQGEQAFTCFELMQAEGIIPNRVTYISILKACGTVGALDRGIEIHDKIRNLGLLSNDTALGNALVDMYVKCGALAKARCVLEEFPSQNVVSWSALIAGYAQQGQEKQVLDCFRRMQHDGICPNSVTFACVLNVCSHLGLVTEGDMIFQAMKARYDVKPDIECYTCMIDLFGRAGQLEKAVELIQAMALTNHLVVWHALLGACRRWGDTNIGRWAFEQAVKLGKNDGPAYALMGSIYTEAGMQENAKDIKVMRSGIAWSH